jgi:hypothetical protein
MVGGYDATILARFLVHIDCFKILAQARGGIFKLLRSPGIDSKESVPPAYVALHPILTRFLAPIDRSKIPAQVGLRACCAHGVPTPSPFLYS